MIDKLHSVGPKFCIVSHLLLLVPSISISVLGDDSVRELAFVAGFCLG